MGKRIAHEYCAARNKLQINSIEKQSRLAVLFFYLALSSYLFFRSGSVRGGIFPQAIGCFSPFNFDGSLCLIFKVSLIICPNFDGLSHPLIDRLCVASLKTECREREETATLSQAVDVGADSSGVH